MECTEFDELTAKYQQEGKQRKNKLVRILQQQEKNKEYTALFKANKGKTQAFFEACRRNIESQLEYT